MRFSSILKVGMFLGVLALGMCYAQTTRGIIAGTVTDSTGAVVTGATINVERTDGGEKRTTTTGPNGEYRIEALTPGSYKVTASSANFSTVEVTGVVVSASVITPLNVKLDVGKASTTITVESSGQAVQTESGGLDGVIPSAQVKDLPIASGNPYSLATTLPGVTTPDQRDDFANGPSFTVDGLRPRGNNFLIDGFDNNDYGISGQALQPGNQEAIQEVTVLKNSYSAEYGRGGSSVSNISFKSGTNTIHGSGWWQYSGSSLDAVSYEDAASGATRPPHVVNNLFGFTVGGPIIKDKLFFFATPQWIRNYGAQPAAQITIPTAAGVSTLQSLLPNPNVQLFLDSLSGLAAAIPTGTVVADDRPGCTPCNVEVGHLTRSDPGVSLSHEWTVRGDYLPTSSDTIYVRYTDTHSSLTPDLFANSGALPSQDTLQGGPARNVGVMWAHTFGPKALNELRFSGQQIAFTFGPTAATLANPIAHDPGVTFSTGFSGLALGGFSQGTFPQGRSHKTFQIQDAASITRGAHSLKLGVDLAVILVQDQIPFNSDGLISFHPGGACLNSGAAATCTALANFIDNFSGASGTISKQFGNPNISVPTNQQGFYFQDTWKIRSNFTLDYGIRYEYQPPDASNVLLYPAINRSTVLSDPFQTRLTVQPDRNNWGPRLGFSYSPRFWEGLLGNNKTVIRGGAGIFYDTFFTNISDNTASASPNTLGGTITAPSSSAQRGTANATGALAGISPAASPLNTVTSVVSNLRNPQTYQWNLNVQRELPASFIAEVAYVGTRGTRLFVNEQLNPRDPTTPTDSRLNPARGSIVARGNSGDSIYHGLQTQVSRTFGRVSFRGAYTFSKVLDNGSEVFATTGGASRWQNVRDPRSDRGPSAFDRRQRAAFTWVYELPSPGNRILKQVLGGWLTTGVVSFQTGAPETVYFGGIDQNGDGEGFNDRPSMGNPAAAVHITSNCVLDPTCSSGVGEEDGSGNLVDFEKDVFLGDFTTTFPRDQFKYLFNLNGANGNVQRNSIRLPGQQNWTLGVIKRFKLPYREGLGLEFRADFFNAFNHSNAGTNGLGGYGDLLNLDFFGDNNSTRSGGRQIQTWMKVTF